APKSTGREDFHLGWLMDSLQYQPVERLPEDVQATLVMLTATSIAHAIQTTELDQGELWLCGGGAYNASLWTSLATLLPDWTLHSTAALGLAPTWVEAAAFAWLAQQRMQQQSGNLPRVTGAQGRRVLGAIYAP
ncbi:MAG: anhydro-N-acetylmuramic acid kinase, partial [Pseudomonadota bacterium]|nr:anhydro-N-acetylmuramic acid kinase [Pseudomonadota bacterium]